MRVPTITPKFLDHVDEYYGDVVGVVTDDGTEFTYGELVDRVNRLSNALRDRGVSPGDRVCVLSPNTHWCLETMYAVQQLGGIFVPLNYRLIPSDYEYLLADAAPTAVIVDYEYADLVAELRDDVPPETFVCYRSSAADGTWVDYETLLAEASGSPPDRPGISEDDPASINYTSGTTGEPKGVVRTHRTDFWNATVQTHNLGLDDGSVYLWTLPMFHVNGWGGMYAVTGQGGTHVCQREFSAERTFERIRSYDVSHLAGAPIVLNRLLDHHGEDVVTAGANDVTFATAGASPPKATIEAIEDVFGWHLIHLYGHTESGPYTNSDSPRRIAQHGRMAVTPKQGIPVVGNEMRVVDADGNDVPRDDETIGEIVLRGNLVFDRYWNKPEATAEAFDDRVTGWFHSGDLGTVDDHGFVTLVDRRKDLIISGGENISSIELEDTIYDLPSVQQVAVIPAPHPDWGETPKALIVREPGAELDQDTVIEHCRANLASFKVPSTVEFVETLPETATGKIKKHELLDRYWADADRVGDR